MGPIPIEGSKGKIFSRLVTGPLALPKRSSSRIRTELKRREVSEWRDSRLRLKDGMAGKTSSPLSLRNCPLATKWYNTWKTFIFPIMVAEVLKSIPLKISCAVGFAAETPSQGMISGELLNCVSHHGTSFELTLFPHLKNPKDSLVYKAILPPQAFDGIANLRRGDLFSLSPIAEDLKRLNLTFYCNKYRTAFCLPVPAETVFLD